MATELQALQKPEQRAVSAPMSFFNVEGFELMQRIAKAFSTSDLVPKQYQGNLPNCMIALDMAQRIGANPLMVMQNLYVVHGNPGWSSKFLIATVNTCGRFSSLRYEWKGDPGAADYGCRAWATEKETGERLDGIWVTWSMVKAEGWSSKSGSKWNTMPDQMFIYRAAAFWQRAYAPDLAMGLQTQEELKDVYDAGKGADGTFRVDMADIESAGRVGSESQTIDFDSETGEVNKVEPSTPTKEQKAAMKAEALRKKQEDAAAAAEANPTKADDQGDSDFAMD